MDYSPPHRTTPANSALPSHILAPPTVSANADFDAPPHNQKVAGCGIREAIGRPSPVASKSALTLRSISLNAQDNA